MEWDPIYNTLCITKHPTQITGFDENEYDTLTHLYSIGSDLLGGGKLWRRLQHLGHLKSIMEPAVGMIVLNPEEMVEYIFDGTRWYALKVGLNE